jgi:outer membrane lipoprotein
MLISGCGPVISEKVMREVVKDASSKDVVRDPARYKGITILWGGLILKAKPVKDGTLIEVSQWPVDFRGMPQDVRFSDGKFLALDRQPLDLSIFEKGRMVTIAGIVQGKQVSSWEKSNYFYPMILVKEIHPWPGKGKDSEYNRYYYWEPWTLP